MRRAGAPRRNPEQRIDRIGGFDRGERERSETLHPRAAQGRPLGVLSFDAVGNHHPLPVIVVLDHKTDA